MKRCPTFDLLVLIAWLGLSQGARSQSGSLDLSFAPALNLGGVVYVVTLQTDGQILIGGTFDTIGTVHATNIARLNADGSPDASFKPGAAVDRGYVTTLAVQADGKILVGGSFFSSLGIAQGNFTRLNADGSVDTAFDLNVFVDAPLNAIVLQNDGKILLGGSFANVNFMLRRSVARVNSDGTLDGGFDACVAASAGEGATGLAWQSDGSIYASGQFTFQTGVSRDGIARLRDCGDLDPSFDPQPGVNAGATVFTLASRPDATVLLGGNFQSVQSTPRSGLVQLTATGLVDDNFDPGSGIISGGTVYTVAHAANGQILIAGNFSEYDGRTESSMARINANGELDATFDVGLGPNNAISSLAIQPDGQILVGGRFDAFNGVARTGLARLRGGPHPFHLSAPSRLANGQWQLFLYGENQTHYSVETSSNLVHWVALTNLTTTSSVTPFVDPDSARQARFYRALR
jgi:uncharacterized delta-60 repeat protein